MRRATRNRPCGASVPPRELRRPAFAGDATNRAYEWRVVCDIRIATYAPRPGKGAVGRPFFPPAGGPANMTLGVAGYGRPRGGKKRGAVAPRLVGYTANVAAQDTSSSAAAAVRTRDARSA